MTDLNAKTYLDLNSHAMNWILGCKCENSDTGPPDVCNLKFSKYDIKTSDPKLPDYSGKVPQNRT